MMSMVQNGGDGNSPSDIAWQVCESVQSGLRLDDVILYLINEDETELVQTAAAGPKNSPGRNILNPIRIPVGGGIVGSVAKTGLPEIISDTSRDSRYILDDEYRYSEITVPVILSGRLIGVLDSEYVSRGFYTSDHLAKMELMASVASTHIARVMAEIRLESVSQRKNQLEQVVAQQLEMNEQLSSMEKWLPRMNRDVAHILQHELRTPLNAIMGVSDLLDDFCNRNELSEKQLLPFAGILRRSGQDLVDRITDLLELPRLCGGRRPVAMHKIDVAALLEDLRSRVEDKFLERGLLLELDVPSNVTTLCCDPVALGRVIYGLIDNAAKFSSDGSVLLRLVADEKGRPTEIAVIDQGIGIEKAHLDRIFEPFFQVDQGRNRQYGGLGLGLPVAQRLCRDMGYELSVDSRRNHGSAFRVKLESL
jgi:signal transduction histidine kinase